MGRAFVLLQGSKFLRSFDLSDRITIGSGEAAKLRLNSEDVPTSWGVLFEMKGKVFAQRDGGAMAELHPADGFDVGPYTVVRADAGSGIARLCQGLGRGHDLEFGKREPFNKVVVMGGAGSFRARSQSSSSSSDELQRPAGLQKGGVLDAAGWGADAAGVANRSRPGAAGGTHYDSEPLQSQKTDRLVAQFVKDMERNTQDAAELERMGQEFLETLRYLSYPEIVHVLRHLATGWAEVNYLEMLYERVLNRSPMLAFRWATIIAERYAASARGIGDSVALPKLAIGLSKYVTPDATDAFRATRERGTKRVGNGPWG